ncbi:Glycoside hydrolase family 5 protein [Mycena venus]|uniref:Glycoside hydrolase family 5 protein n=1 Tax=Mycena venus TaxID=2733690 RepID=A0A8H6X3I4_9AGAR|nr:Glycoside hydrolase family 5 protein [Mycena venus]
MHVRAEKNDIIVKIVGAVTGEDGSTVTTVNRETFLVSHTGLVDPEKPFASSTKPNSSTPALNESRTWGVDRINGVNLGAGQSSNPACRRAAVLQQSPLTSSESSLSTIMRADGTQQAKLEEHYGMFIYQPPDDEKGLSAVGYRLLTENIFTLALCGTSFTKNKTAPTHSERSTRKTRPSYHDTLWTRFDSFNLSSSKHSL